MQYWEASGRPVTARFCRCQRSGGTRWSRNSVWTRRNDLSNASFASRPAPATASAPPDTALPSQVGTDAVHDHFVYATGRHSLRKGARAAIGLWTMGAGLSDVYTATVTAPQSALSRPGELAQNEVWHQVDLGNPSDMPWTTGPLLFVDGVLPVAQGLLGYTPAGASTRVPMTKAVDIRAEGRTTETGRDASPVRIDKHDYIRVVREVEVVVTSFRDVRSEVEIDTRVLGKVLEVSGGGSAELTTRGRLQAQSDVRWTLTLKPGESRTLKAKFETYVR